MDEQHYLAFFEKYVQNRHTPEEHTLFLDWFNRLTEPEADNVMAHYLRLAEEHSYTGATPADDGLIRKIEARLDDLDAVENEETSRKVNWGGFRRWAAAAALILVGYGTYFQFFKKADTVLIQPTIQLVNDVAPGGNKAILTLSDGSDIVLDDATTGEIATQSGIRITKKTDGQLVYNAPIDWISSPQVFNTIKTPKAGKYQINLADGTKVWLNSLSSIRFPTVFAGNERKVEITGEAYFEVASLPAPGKNETKMPFLVISRNQVVEVMGTHFNVNSYIEEATTKTTLLEGSVRVSTMGAGKATVRLKPGEQSIIHPVSAQSANAPAIRIENPDIEGVIAWKEGYFKFKDTEIREIMRQLARWYDIEVTYKGNLPPDQFTGFVSKNVQLSSVLKMLEQGGGVKFTITGKKIEVAPAE